jgi:ferredoxin
MCHLCEQYGDGDGNLWYLNPKLYEYQVGDDPSSEATALAWQMDWSDWQGVYEKTMLVGEYKHHQLVPLEDALKIADLHQSIAPDPHFRIAVCMCVQMTTGQDIRKCMNFGFTGDVISNLMPKPKAPPPTGQLARGEVTVDDWKARLIELDKEGWVHSLLIWGRAVDKAYPSHMCNCKNPTCFVLRGRDQRGIENQNFKAHYVAEINGLECDGCGKCSPACQFGATRVDKNLGLAYIDPRLCYGCGVCRQRCKKDAISLIDRDKVPIARNLW